MVELEMKIALDMATLGKAWAAHLILLRRMSLMASCNVMSLMTWSEALTNFYLVGTRLKRARI